MSCLYFVERRPGLEEAVICERVRALVDFYGPLGATPDAATAFAGDGVLAGSIGMPVAESLGGRQTCWWLERAPAALQDARALLDADDRALRAVHTGLLAGLHAARSRLVTGPCGPTSLYVASGPRGRAWSTHAVAAAVLATGTATVDPESFPQLLALGLVGGERCMIERVRAVPPATRIDFSAEGVREGTYWPTSERWASAPAPAEAPAAAQQALLRSLESRLSREPGPWLGITAGLDSRVLGAALAELGLGAKTFTWSHDPVDAPGGRDLAAALGLPHATLAPVWLDEPAGLEAIDREVRWNEGLGRMNPFGALVWPAGMTAFVTGAGGEVGRAFWWRGLGRNHPNPDLDRLAAWFRPDRALPGAPPDVRATLQRDVRGMLEEVVASGLEGWAVLDALYAEQRLTRWGRGMLGRHAVATIAGFAEPTLMACLSALTVEDRLTDGFHLRFLRSIGRTDLEPAPSAVQRRGVPRPVRRMVAAARAVRRRDEGPWAWNDHVAGFPAYREWLDEGVLAHPLVDTAFGRSWIDRSRRAFGSDHNAAAGEIALVLSGPVALVAALEDLRPAG